MEIPGLKKTGPEYLGPYFRRTIKKLSEKESEDFFRILEKKKNSRGKLNLEDTVRTAITIGKSKDLQKSVDSIFNYAMVLMPTLFVAPSYMAANYLANKCNTFSPLNLLIYAIPSSITYGAVCHIINSYHKKKKVKSIIEHYPNKDPMKPFDFF